MGHFLFDTPVERGRKQHFNPRPFVPETGWERPKTFPSLSSATAIGVDLETYDPELKEFGAGWGRNRGHIIGAAVSTNDGFSGYYPIRHEDEGHDNFRPEDVLSWLRGELSRPNQWKVGHNLLYDLGFLAHEGVPVVGPLYDTWIAEKLIHPREDASLEATGQRRVGKGKKSTLLLRWLHQFYGRGPTPEDDDLDESQKGNLYKAPPRLVGPYAISDVELPLEIAEVQYGILEEMGLMKVFTLECELLPILVAMRLAGVTVDVKNAELADIRLTQEIDVLQKEIDHIVGTHLEVGSGEKVGAYLSSQGFTIPRTEKSKQYSVKEETLKRIEHPVAEKVLDIRELIKFQGTFIRSYILDSHINGKIYCNFNQMKAVTGRYSSSQPNLTNLPSKNPELMKVIRGCFIPDSGHAEMRKYDYSQVECRILAHFATGRGADRLREQYNQEPLTNYHRFTHQMILDMSGIDLPHKQVKNCNFAVCLAEGSLVLTQRGEVPIQDILLEDVLWDGVDWVKHQGVIYKGIQKVIQYEGLTATPDHEVWTYDGRKIPFVQAALGGIPLCFTGKSGEYCPINFEGKPWTFNTSGNERYRPSFPVRMKVYDILNAGPRRRFTCSGVLVSNCYGASQKKLAKMIGLTPEDTGPFFEAYHGSLQFIRDTMESISRETARTGYSSTILGRRVPFDLWEGRFMGPSESDRHALTLDKAIAKWGAHNLQRAYLFKALNYTIQGSSADLLKSATVKAWKDGIYKATGLPKAFIHDEKLMSVPDLSKSTVGAYKELKHIMETAIKFRVPIVSEGEHGPSWGNTTKITD